MTPERIQEHLQTHFRNSQVEVQSDDQTHFFAQIVSDDFQGLNLLKRQKLVYSALGDWIKDGTIHAFSMKTYTWSEWQSLG